MPTKALSEASAPVPDESDPRFLPVIAACEGLQGFSLMESKSGAMRGLMLNGRSFGMSSHGRLILKLNAERADALIASGVGEAFSPSPGRVMKGWIDVTNPKVDWVALAQEALGIASAQGRKGPRG